MRTKPEVVTYDLVCAAIEELSANKEKVSIRNIIAKTGGSATKISDFLKRYNKEKSLTNKYVVSDSLLAALAFERNTIKLEADKAKESEIKALNEIIEDLKAINNKNEKDLADFAESKRYNLFLEEHNKGLERDLTSAKRTADESLTRLGTITERYNVAIKKIKTLEAGLEILNKTKDENNKELATWQARAEQAESQIQKLYDKFKLKQETE